MPVPFDLRWGEGLAPSWHRVQLTPAPLLSVGVGELDAPVDEDA
jgi:hypothetical protein